MGKKNRLVFAGTYSEVITLGTGEVLQSKGEGIYTFRMNPETGELTLLQKAVGEPNPTYLVLDKSKRYLYSTNELKTFRGIASGAASSFEVNPKTGRLTLLNRQITGGTDAVHILLNKDSTHAFVANFMSGSVSVFPVNQDGSLDKVSCFLQHKGTGPNPVRQRGAHAHGFELDRLQKRAFVPDLGCDKVFVYDIDYENGHLYAAPHPYVSLHPGEGPRHCVLDSTGRFLYVINEMGNTIYVFAYNEDTSELKELQIVPTIPPDFTGHSTCSAVKIHPNGKFLYGSNRGHDSVALYRINQDTGLLTMIDIIPTGGRTPRDFEFDPEGNFMIAGNQDSHVLVVFKVDGTTGALTEVQRVENIFTVTCLKIYDIDNV